MAAARVGAGAALVWVGAAWAGLVALGAAVAGTAVVGACVADEPEDEPLVGRSGGVGLGAVPS